MIDDDGIQTLKIHSQLLDLLDAKQDALEKKKDDIFITNIQKELDSIIDDIIIPYYGYLQEEDW